MTLKKAPFVLAALALAGIVLAANKIVPDNRGTEQQPFVVKAVPIPNDNLARDKLHAIERAQDLQDRESDIQQREKTEHWNRIIGIATIFILVIQAIAFWIQAREMRRSVNEMKAATQTGRDTLAAEQRPWVKLKVDLGKLPFHDGLDWHFHFVPNMTNMGRTPAVRAQFHAHVIPFMDDYQSPDKSAIVKRTNVAEELRKWTENISSRVEDITSGFFGSLLFPDDHVQGDYGVQRGDAGFYDSLNSPAYVGQFTVLSCISYQSTIDNSWHPTAVAYNLRIEAGYHDLSTRFELVDGKFKINDRRVFLHAHPWANNYAT